MLEIALWTELTMITNISPDDSTKCVIFFCLKNNQWKFQWLEALNESTKRDFLLVMFPELHNDELCQVWELQMKYHSDCL